ncbi:Polygalacturonase inhibitor 2 [Platanthera zijinensis]|uniref:Polygalacturonase inhibitor 2 n=1 Tax=Platanthera zijinensis TaxID=2320716 RepID=A0AAP0AXN9_9ASPA
MAALNQLVPIPLLRLFFFFFFLASQLALACDAGDRAVLLKIKAGFQNPGKFTSWDESVNCCTWYGVLCYPHDDGGRVTSLIYYNIDGASSGGLFGRLPDELGDLPFLSSLVLGNHPNVYGVIPLTLTRLTRLSFLNLAHNSLSGALPSFLSQIHSLAVLNLSFNKFRGLIPPEFFNFAALRYLSLEANDLEGVIPSTIGNLSKFPLPLHFTLSHNMLSGDIPAELGVPNWETLDLSHNMLTGDPTALFAANKAITYMDLSFNKLEFDLTGIEFPIKLKKLALQNNMITGSIPPQINKLDHLFGFNVSYNQLCGIIPAGPVMNRFDDTSFFRNKCLCRSKDTCLAVGF